MTALAARKDLGAPLRWTAPFAFAAIGAVYALAVGLGAEPIQALAIAPVAIVCAAIAEIDRRHYLIPDLLVAALACVAALFPLADPKEALVGALCIGGLFLAVRQGFASAGRADALGLGDVKLATAMGLLLGLQFGLIAVAFAGLATLAVAAPAALSARHGAAAIKIPFGIGLAAALTAITIVLIWGGL
ncbi:MAG: prepilin peptidase [Terricaulis sp.]